MVHAHEALISVDQAIQRLTQDLPLLPEERVELAEALGRVLSRPVLAPHPLPPFDHSAMDGYAVRAEDLNKASESTPVELKVIGEAAAGHLAEMQLESGQVARITTGAPIPAGANGVVPVEYTEDPKPMGGKKLAQSILIHKAVDAGDFIRPAGMDLAEGAPLFQAGQRLRSQDIGLLAAAGVAEPYVRSKARVAVLSTGDEVIEVERQLEPGLIRDSNGLMIRAALQAQGASPIPLGIAEDPRESVRERLNNAVAEGADLILSSAGVSMGAHDYVRLVLEEHGQLSFWRVNVRPGKPLAFGNYQGVPFIGLPGNPVSAWITFSLFVQPALAVMSGQSVPYARTVIATLANKVNSDGRESYLRVVLNKDGSDYQARLTGSQDSAVLSSLARADGLLIIPAGTKQLPAGSEVEVWLMGEFGLVGVSKPSDGK